MGEAHSHGVDFDRAGSKPALKLVLALTTAFMVAEVVGGLTADVWLAGLDHMTLQVDHEGGELLQIET